METTKLSSKGQLVIPKAMRDAHGWQPGTEFTVEDRGGEIVLRPVAVFARTSIEDVRGSIKYDGPAKSIEEMNEAVGRMIARRWRRRRA